MKKFLILIIFISTYAMATSTSDMTVAEKQICIDQVVKKDRVILTESRTTRNMRKSMREARIERKISSEDSEQRVFRKTTRMVRHSRISRARDTVRIVRHSRISRARDTDHRIVRHSRVLRCVRIARGTRVTGQVIHLASL